MLLPDSVTVTVAPGTTAPALSLTVPTMVPVVTWAWPDPASPRITASATTNGTPRLAFVIALSVSSFTLLVFGNAPHPLVSRVGLLPLLEELLHGSGLSLG